MASYQVDYVATYYVEANDEDEAIDLAIEIHNEMPDGDWQANKEYIWPKIEGK